MSGQDRNIEHLQSQMLKQERPLGLALEDPALTELLLPQDCKGSSKVSPAAAAECPMELSSKWRFQAAGGFIMDPPVLHSQLLLQAPQYSPTGSGKEQPVGEWVSHHARPPQNLHPPTGPWGSQEPHVARSTPHSWSQHNLQIQQPSCSFSPPAADISVTSCTINSGLI